MIVAHVVLGDPADPSARGAEVLRLRQHLAAMLESAAVPARIVSHEGGLPLLPSGKIDRRTLTVGVI